MTDLRELLRDASASGLGPVDLDAVLREGRRRVRRRRLVVAGVMTGAVASLMAVALVVAPRLPGQSEPDPAGPDPVRISADDAIRVQPDVLVEKRVVDTRRFGPLVTFDGISDDGKVLVHRFLEEAFAHQPGLLDPRTGEVTWYDPPPTQGGLGLGDPISLGPVSLTFAQADSEGRWVNVLSLDRRDGTWAKTRVDTVVADPFIWFWSPFLGPEGRLWFFGGGGHDGPPFNLWSAATTASEAARLELTFGDGNQSDEIVTLPSGDAGAAAWIEPGGQRVVVRNLVTGATWSGAPDPGCQYSSVHVAGAHVVVDEQCRAGHVTEVYATEGELLWTIEGLGTFEAAADGTNLVTVPGRDGFFVLDLEELELYEVASEGCGERGWPPDTPTVVGGGLMSWCDTSDDGTLTYLVAEIPADP